MVTHHTSLGYGMALKRKLKTVKNDAAVKSVKQCGRKLLLRKKVVDRSPAYYKLEDAKKLNLTEAQIKEYNADLILPRKPDYFITKNAIYPSHILSSKFADITEYERKLYFSEAGVLESTNEEGQPRDRTLPRYNKNLKSNPTKAKTSLAKGDAALVATGRPKRSFGFTDILRALTLKPSAHSADKTVARMIMEVLLDKCQRGDIICIKEVYNRLEGKVPDRLQLNDPSKSARDAQTVLEALMGVGFSGGAA